jgi:hypothetical protein
MKILAVLSSILILGLASASPVPQSNTKPDAPHAGKFQIVSGNTDNGPKVFRLDTETGDVWQYQAPSNSSPAFFFPVKSVPQSQWPQP